jgi:hypothetical protein
MRVGRVNACGAENKRPDRSEAGKKPASLAWGLLTGLSKVRKRVER